MKTILRFALTPADLDKARALREEIRSIHLSRYGRDLLGEVDPRLDGRTMCAYDRGKMVGSVDVHWGGDGAIAPSKLAHHRVNETAPGAPPTAVVVLDEAMIHPKWEQEPVAIELNEGAARFALRVRARWVFSSCHPADVGVYAALGFRACGAPTYDPVHGETTPLALDLADVEGLRRARSPLADLASQVQAAVQAQAATEPAQTAATAAAEAAEDKLDTKAMWRQIFELQREARASGAAFLSDIQDSEISRLLLGSRVVPLKKGQRIIKRGERKRDLFLVLSGQVEVKVEDRVVAVLGAGDVVGEIGLLLATERTGDVFAAVDNTTCLRLSEAHLQEVMAKDPALAARISLGIAKALCLKLIRTSGL